MGRNCELQLIDQQLYVITVIGAHDMKVSFCTTSKNRKGYVEGTLGRNLSIAQDPEKYEFVLLDYNSDDGLEEYVHTRHKKHIKSGLLSFYRTAEPVEFIHSHAKNCAHRLAKGDVVVNLDSDNIINEAYLDNVVTIRPGELINTRGELNLTGRIALFKDQFEMMGGYDEQMVYGWGWEDEDLIIRCQRYGFIIRTLLPEETGTRLIHSDYERTQHCKIKDKTKSWKAHRMMSRFNVHNGFYIANYDNTWGQCNLAQ